MSNPVREYESKMFGRIISQKHIRNTVVHNVLKVAWERFRPIRMLEVDEQTMSFEFDSERDRDQIMDLTLWSVQGHLLNLKTCKANMCLEEIDFSTLQIWIQIYGLSLDMYNKEMNT